MFGDTIAELSAWSAFNPEPGRGESDAEDDEDAGDPFDGADGEDTATFSDWTPRSVAIRPASNPFKAVGRNDPCPCGSGRKFKKCCLDKAAA
jgi:uncharacterized protein YecA (UPF0149 family)